MLLKYSNNDITLTIRLILTIRLSFCVKDISFSIILFPGVTLTY